MINKSFKQLATSSLLGILLWVLNGTVFAQEPELNPTVGLRNTPDFLFAADSKENLIDVVSVHTHKVVHRFQTKYYVDQVLATPNAPLLIYTNIEHKRIVAINLLDKTVYKDIALTMTPRHVVLDTSGVKLGISDSIDGGFVLLHAYSMEPILELPDFVPTPNVLFDPNEVDIYYSNNLSGAVGIIDSNTGKTWEMNLYPEATQSSFSSPSRSLDSQYIYVADKKTSKVFAVSAYTREVLQSYDVDTPARPYSSPAGFFLYILDEKNGKFTAIEQHQFMPFAEVDLASGIDKVVVGQFDRMNLLLSTKNKNYYLFDNNSKTVTLENEFKYIPLSAEATADGKTAFVSFFDAPLIAAIDLADGSISYFDATNNGVGASTAGLSNTVCH
ncbi:MAG: hypothetical protein P8J68_00550 [Arenicellaceae bacterium]|nr:hypothetical protein [Arenicellaceae bacterium]